jgi:hypothetical protein
MALKLVRRPWGRQPIGAAGINWGHPRAEGLAFFAPLSGAHGTRDLVQEQLGVRTGLEEYVPAQNGAIYHRFFSANRADFPLLPLGIGLNTPFTLAWTQEPRSGSAYSALLVVNFGTAGTDHQFTIYQSTSDASYSMVTGPLGAWSSASNTPRFSGIGVAANERLDRFVLQCSGGSQSVTTGDYVLWRNGERFTTSATAVISAYRTAAFRIGALSDAGDPFEGLIGDMRMWSRVLSDGEAEEESTVHGSWALFEPQRIWVPVSTVGGGSYTLQVTPGSYSITVNDVSLIAARSVQVTQGSYAITGNDVGLAAGVVLSALTGAYAYAGNDVGLTASRQLAVTAGSYSITGNVAGLNAARLLTATPGAYSISGNSVILTYNTVGSYTLNVTAGSYAITGNDVALTASRTLAVTAGSYSTTGSDVVLTYGVMHTLNVTPGAYAITGYSAMLAKASTLQALAGAYAYTGRNVVLTYSGLADGALDVVHLLSRVTPNVQLLAALTQTVRLQGHVPEFAGLSSPIP